MVVTWGMVMEMVTDMVMEMVTDIVMEMDLGTEKMVTEDIAVRAHSTMAITTLREQSSDPRE